MGHVTGPRSCSGCRSTHERSRTIRISNPNASRSREWKLKSGGWKSISARVAKKSCDGAAMSAWSGRSDAPTVHAKAVLPEIRAAGYGVEDIAIHRFRAEPRKPSYKESGNPAI